jgi:hypothetical protein
MLHLGKLAMDRYRRAHDVAAESLADGLMAKADAKDRDGGRGLVDQLEANAGIVRRAGSGREHDGLGVSGNDLVRRDLVVAMHGNIGPEPAQIMEQVEGKAVVIVDQQDHGRPFWCVLKVLDAAAPAGQGGGCFMLYGPDRSI